MPPPAMLIRTIESTADHEAFFYTTNLAYTPDIAVPDPDGFAHWNGSHERRSAILPTTLRGAFLDSLCLGTCQLEERLLCIGPARIRVGCIGEVATHPDFRQQGIATALMRDAIALAKQEEYPLLLLFGIHNFYGRFGFTNVMDYPIQIVKLADLAKQPASPYTVRAATMDDSSALLELYQSHYNRFERSAALQEDHLYNLLPHNPPWLVCDEHNQPHGYLLLREDHATGRAEEVAATNWPATLALLHHHAALLKLSSPSPTALRWSRPFDTPQAYETSDHLPVQWEIHSVPDGEWMAHVTDIPAFVRLLEVLWRARWQAERRVWSGRVTQIIGDYAFTLEMDEHGLRLLDRAEMEATTLRLHPSTFTRLVFGCRPISWALLQPDTHVPKELMAVAELLYPLDSVWFPPSDGF